MTEATGAKRARLAEEALEFARRRQARVSPEKKEDTSAAEKRSAQIKDNPFFKIIFDEKLSLEEKQKAIAKAAAYDETKTEAENAAQLAALEEFKEFLMDHRKEQAEKIIRLHNTETFGELQRVFEDMNASLLDFENQIGPLVEIIEAVNRLNMASDGAIYNIYQEIQDDKAEEERIAKLRAEKEAEIKRQEGELNGIDRDVAALREKKRMFGLLGPSQETLMEIARRETDKTRIIDDIKATRTELAGVAVERESKYAEFATEKGKLRELLDLTSDEHRDRQKALVNAALTFVRNMEERSGSVLEHMRGVKDQIADAETTSGKLSKIFAVVNEGVKEAEELNRGLTTKFEEAAEGETAVERVQREDKLSSVKKHVEATSATKLDTLETLGELAKESRDIRSMMETNTRQIDSTRKLHTSGTAGVASRLSVVLTAVNGAALNESRAGLQNTLSNMNRLTGDIAGMEAIKNATGLAMQNDALSKAIEELDAYRQISDQATEITRQNLEEQRRLQAEIEAEAQKLAEAVKRAKGVAADVMQADDGSPRPAREQDNGDRRPASKPAGLGELKI